MDMDEGFDTVMKEKTDDDINTPDGNHVTTRNGIKANLMLQRSVHGATALHVFYLPVNIPVQLLKKSVEHMFKVSPDCQRWFFKNKELNDDDTITGSKIRTEDYIHVKIEKQDQLSLL